MAETVEDTVDRLIAGHDGGPLMANFPDHLVPMDLAQTYAMQDMIMDKLGPVGGWKVMAGGEGEPLCAPIPASRYYPSGAHLRGAHHNLVLTEIEVAVRLSRDLPAGVDSDAIENAIGAFLPAIEMVGSPFVDRDKIPFNAKLADLQSNGAVVVGPDFSPDIADHMSSLAVALELDGVPVKEVATGASKDAIIEALRWLAGHAAQRGRPLRAGEVIITGSRILYPHGNARAIVGNFGHWGQVSARLIRGGSGSGKWVQTWRGLPSRGERPF
ncbi:MAG: fumarylacetoacetate hydrolase family protein [Devosia sp.]